jgi:hypothetical protein
MPRTDSTRRRGGTWLLLTLMLGWFGQTAPAQAEPAEFVLDPEHTSITFFTHHLGFADICRDVPRGRRLLSHR